MDDLTKAIGEFESNVVNDINACNLHPAVIELVLTNLLNQVKAVKNQMDSGGIQNDSNSTDPSSSEGDN